MRSLQDLKPATEETPLRSIERDYLSILSSKLTPERWTAIVSKAIEKAESGDYRARDWLSQFALPGDLTILDLASQEFHGKTSAQIVESYKPPVVLSRRAK